MTREENPFEDLKRELVNGYSDRRTFASSYDEFVSRLLYCIQTTLNGTYIGRSCMEDALQKSIDEQWTAEKWQSFKVNTLRIFFFLVLDNCPLLKHEFSEHLYNELRKQPEPQAEKKGGSH